MNTIETSTLSMENDMADTLIELGTASVETRGRLNGPDIEGGGFPFRL